MALQQQFTSGTDATAADLNASSIPVVGSTADVVTPFNGQIVLRITDNTLHRYTGAAWVLLDPSNLGAPPYYHGYQISGLGQTLSDVTPTAITMTGEVLDTISGHSTSTNTSRYTPSVAGYYKCKGRVILSNTPSATVGMAYAQIRKNGAVVAGAPYGANPMQNQAFAFNSATCDATISLNGTTDYVELWGAQDSGGTLGTAASTTEGGSYLICEWISP